MSNKSTKKERERERRAGALRETSSRPATPNSSKTTNSYISTVQYSTATTVVSTDNITRVEFGTEESKS